MERIVEYKTIIHLNVESFDNQVNCLLQDGFEIYGSPYQVIDFCEEADSMDIRPVSFLAQAMIRKEDSDNWSTSADIEDET